MLDSPLDARAIEARLSEIIDAHVALEGPMLPILHAVQAEWGHIPEPAIPAIALALNLGRAEVHGVVSFYHDFRTTPAGTHVVKLCSAEACQAQGGRGLAASVLERLGVEWGATTPDGRVTVEAIYCLGICACGPAAMIDGRLIGRVTPAMVVEALA